ncbi:MAG: hypothetical protein ACQKBT_02525 [Puniceicoccales bacterium]
MIVLHESRHLQEPGFFRTLFRALQRSEANVRIQEERPFPRASDERGMHDGAWISWDGARVFVDMSDHVFQFDPIALREADLYLKANLHRGVAAKVFAEKGLVDPGDRLQPYTFLAPGLPRCRQIRRVLSLSGIRRRLRRPGTICHVVGVYENLKRDGESIPAEGEVLSPSQMHFWIRQEFAETLRERAMPGSTVRLVSRGNPAIEDGRWVLPNLSYRRFLLSILRADALVLNTFPHALYPWKAFEAVALGVPVVAEMSPLVECPSRYQLRAGSEMAEVLPGVGDFDRNLPLSNPASYRVLRWPGREALREGIASVLDEVKKPESWQERRRGVHRFSKEQLSDCGIAKNFRGWVDGKLAASNERVNPVGSFVES